MQAFFSLLSRMMTRVAAIWVVAACSPAATQAQSGKLIVYYDSTYQKVSQEQARYSCEFTPYEDLYICQCYYQPQGTPMLVGIRAEPDMHGIRLGLNLQYDSEGHLMDSTYYYGDGKTERTYSFHENGRLKDSVKYDRFGNPVYGYHYYPSGVIQARFIKPAEGKEEYLRYDQNGHASPGKIYMREADFPGGNEGWRRFMTQKLNALVPVDSGAPTGTYQVIVRFIVEKDGTLSHIEAETNMGYGMEKEVLRLMQQSPRWKPAIWLDEPILAYRRQPVTFVVMEEANPRRRN